MAEIIFWDFIYAIEGVGLGISLLLNKGMGCARTPHKGNISVTTGKFSREVLMMEYYGGEIMCLKPSLSWTEGW